MGPGSRAHRRMANARSNSDTTEIARTCAMRLPPAADGSRDAPRPIQFQRCTRSFCRDRSVLRSRAAIDPIPDQDWANKIAKYPLVLGNVSFEAILVIEEEPESLALDDQRVEGGQDMNLFLRRIGNEHRGYTGRTQCSDWPAPSSCTGISSFRRTRDSSRRLIAGLRGASR